VLSLRLVLFSLLAGLCLWGLFALLGNLNEPELLRSPKAVVVKGCDSIESDDARRLCPHLLCQKAVLDAKRVAWSSRFEVTVDRTHAGAQLIGGTARAADASEARFACVLHDSKVVAAQQVTEATLDGLARQSEGWALSAGALN
jgi:hypothetical protein